MFLNELPPGWGGGDSPVTLQAQIPADGLHCLQAELGEFWQGYIYELALPYGIPVSPDLAGFFAKH